MVGYDAKALHVTGLMYEYTSIVTRATCVTKVISLEAPVCVEGWTIRFNGIELCKGNACYNDNVRCKSKANWKLHRHRTLHSKRIIRYGGGGQQLLCALTDGDYQVTTRQLPIN